MMLDWLSLSASAESIRRAVDGVLAAGQGTPDLGGCLNTAAFGDLIVERIVSDPEW